VCRARVDAEDDPSDFLVVVLPEIAVAALPRHVEDGDVQVLLLELLDCEAHGRHNLCARRL